MAPYFLKHPLVRFEFMEDFMVNKLAPIHNISLRNAEMVNWNTIIKQS